jgi:hypothetical protein
VVKNEREINVRSDKTALRLESKWMRLSPLASNLTANRQRWASQRANEGEQEGSNPH